MDYDKPLRQAGTVVVMRLCTTASLERAAYTHARSRRPVWDFLEQAYGYSPDRFLISTQPDCVERPGRD
jgi:hypothetical protein